MVNTCSATACTASSQLTPTVITRQTRNSPTPVTPSNCRHSPSRPYAHITEDPGPPDDDDGGGRGDGGDDPDPDDIPDIPAHTPEPVPAHDEARVMKSFIELIAKLAESVNSDKKESRQTNLCEPDTFDGSDPKKLHGFLLQCKLNFHAKPKAFSGNLEKVNYSLSFLKGTALDYFEPYLTDNPDNEPDWLSDYDTFVKELMINFSPYDSIADAEIELEQLVMKENHKATKFFVEFYRISSHLDYNNQALLQKAYLAFTKRIKDEMVHFDKPA
jgi:hypothetical protein